MGDSQFEQWNGQGQHHAACGRLLKLGNRYFCNGSHGQVSDAPFACLSVGFMVYACLGVFNGKENGSILLISDAKSSGRQHLFNCVGVGTGWEDRE